MKDNTTKRAHYRSMSDPTGHSDLYHILSNLKFLHDCYCKATSDYARIGILQGLACDAGVVALKLKYMLKRWKIFLPFKEVIDVNFGQWSQIVGTWNFKERFNPSNGMLLDLLKIEVEVPDPGRFEESLVEYFEKVDSMLKTPHPGWLAISMNELESEFSEILHQPMSLGTMKEIAKRAVEALRIELRNVDQFFATKITEMQFRILAFRLKYRDFKDAYDEAHREVVKARNGWTDKTLCEHAAQMKKMVIQDLACTKYGKELSEYVDFDQPDLFADSKFGRFLFKNRHRLTKKECSWIVKCSEMIRELNLYTDTISADNKMENKEGDMVRDKDRKICVQLQQWAMMARWEGGMTAERMVSGISRMLGIDAPVDKDMAPLCNKMWSLLKARKIYGQDKSTKITWLNMVGLFMEKGYLSGSGSYIYRLFFEDDDSEDRKAIYKGKGRHKSSSFSSIIPLLERYLCKC